MRATVRHSLRSDPIQAIARDDGGARLYLDGGEVIAVAIDYEKLLDSLAVTPRSRNSAIVVSPAYAFRRFDRAGEEVEIVTGAALVARRAMEFGAASAA